ncbi:uncharacterized protein C2845_PM07G06540 [Panicum miliaceum]|uniref:Uncharacterized protein n=1 Tax=Panicum miliaceum TaxID=4540 RepID=A0A3L6SIL1_PANMI|nr:uncharacterized protein C2845_PM07G06540 [Panicum miliaceum]
MASVVVRNDDESASLLDDDDGGSPVSAAGASPPPPLPGKAMRRPRHAVMRLIRSPFAAALRMTTCAREAAIGTSEEERPSNGGDTAGVERRRGEGRRPSLEQLLRMEAAPPHPDRKSEHDTPAPSHDVVTTVQQKRAQERPHPPSKGHSTVVVVSGDDERRHAAAAPAVITKSDDGGAGRRQTSTKRLVVVFASLRQCSRASGISAAMTSKGPKGKVAAAGGRGPGELFYYRPIPMGRRCRVQHLEETPYK